MRRLLRLVSVAVRLAAGAATVGRLARVAGAGPPVRPTSIPATTVSVVIPARNEAARIAPLLDVIVGATGVHEVIVVDDQSSDGTAELAGRLGATVVTGAPLPAGWAGKAWALQQGVEAASGEWVVTLDADTRPDERLPTALVARAMAERLDFVTIGGRFECPTPGTRWLHASMLTTLVYRFGPPGVPMAAGREMANGQCMAIRRQPFLVGDGFTPVRGEVVEDIALARHLASEGQRVGFLDGAEMLTVRMFESLDETWHGWGRSLALPGVDGRRRQHVDLAVVALAQALPLPRLLAGRGDIVDVALLALRVGTLAGTRRAYRRNDAAYWLSPLADTASTVALALGIRRGTAQSWRGRDYT